MAGDAGQSLEELMEEEEAEDTELERVVGDFVRDRDRECASVQCVGPDQRDTGVGELAG